MAGAWVLLYAAATVVFGPLVLIGDQKTDWGAQCRAKLGSGLYLDRVFLVSLSAHECWLDGNESDFTPTYRSG